MRQLPASVELRHRMVAAPVEADCAYVRVAELFDDASLDFSLVDGFTELRDACARAAMPKLKSGGLLVVDNANWFIPHPSRSPCTAKQPFSKIWANLIPQLADWRCIWTSNGVTDTAFWMKPANATRERPARTAISETA